MKYTQNESRKILNELIEEIAAVQPDAPLPLCLSDWLNWLNGQVQHPLKNVPILDFDYPWQLFMRRENQRLLQSASWFARRQSSAIIRKVRVSENFDNDRDYITYTDKYAVTRDTQTSGSGPQAVYIYGFKNDPSFLKIGLAGNASDVDGVFHRVRQQISTSNRMLPTLYHVIFTDNCRALEKALHRKLKDQGRWEYDGAGTEWFRASVDEALQAYDEITAFERIGFEYLR